MKPYELVIVLKASLPADEKKTLLSSVSDILGDTVQKIDDIGVLAAAYPLQGKKENTHVHLVSYYIHTDPKSIVEYSKKFMYLSGMIRHFFYAMGANEEFLTYTEVQKKLEDVMPAKQEK